MLEFIDTFSIHKSFPNAYFAKRIHETLALGETNAAAKLIIAKQMFQDFDLPLIVDKLAEKGASNRKIAVELLLYCPEMIEKLIVKFSTEKDFEFAFDIVQAYKLPIQIFPELQMIKASRHPIVDMAFTDPEVDKKHVPLHVMEDLVSGDKRLLQKLFCALVKNKMPHKAVGLY